MSELVNASLIWENSPDTELNASNLSKTLDYQSESKFIYYTNEDEDYEKWADLIIFGNFQDYTTEDYSGQVIYHKTSHEAKIIVDNLDGTYSAEYYASPYRKLFKIIEKTKIGMNFDIDGGETQYNSFDIGAEDKIFTTDHLLAEDDYLPDTEYEIVLYYHISYGDYAQIKIANINNQDWKEGGDDDPSSPSGKKIISYRTIGGFRTDLSGYVEEGSVWDLSTYRKELAVEVLKKKTDTGSYRVFSASDVPIDDTEDVLSSSNIEDALTEIKLRQDNTYDDTYTVNRFGVDLKYSTVKEDGTTLIDTVTHDITLKITAGYIDVFGERVYIPEDIYLNNANKEIKINNGSFSKIHFLGEGDQNSVNTIYDSSDDGSGTIWRVYIDMVGRIIIKDNNVTRPQYVSSDKLKGWYDLTSIARCIGKFRVRKETVYYIEKQSVTTTYEGNDPLNTVFQMHTTICPDGLLPCDGKWHDIKGIDQNSYDNRPATDMWQTGSWYEETPNLWNRTLRMGSSNILEEDKFSYDSEGNVLSGGSANCGAIGGADNHNHSYNHTHGPGTITVQGSGAHPHNEVQFSGYVDETIYVAEGGTIRVTKDDHDHALIIGGGEHTHDSNDFSGNVETLTNALTGYSESWPPYKEILYCIKK